MAGVTDTVFRGICKGFGADVLTTEFVSAEGILHKNERTEEFVSFDPATERPLGVQLFGGDPGKMAEAARAVLDWKQPDFIDLNFGCPVNKVVAKNGGSSLLRDCPLLERVASTVVRAVAEHAPGVSVTGKIRVGWDEHSINAPQVARILEGCGIRRLAVHGRTRAQGYSGQANWDIIAETAAAVPGLPVIGNGDLASVEMIAPSAGDRGRRGRDDRAGCDGRAVAVSPGENLSGHRRDLARAGFPRTLDPDPRALRGGRGPAPPRRGARGDELHAGAAHGLHPRHGGRPSPARTAGACRFPGGTGRHRGVAPGRTCRGGGDGSLNFAAVTAAFSGQSLRGFLSCGRDFLTPGLLPL